MQLHLCTYMSYQNFKHSIGWIKATFTTDGVHTHTLVSRARPHPIPEGKGLVKFVNTDATIFWRVKYRKQGVNRHDVPVAAVLYWGARRQYGYLTMAGYVHS